MTDKPLYRLIDKDGASYGLFTSAKEAADHAKQIWGGEEQDEDRTGKGWDIEAVPSTD